MVVHACNPSSWEAATGGSPQISGSLGYNNKFEASLTYLARSCLKKTAPAKKETGGQMWSGAHLQFSQIKYKSRQRM